MDAEAKKNSCIYTKYFFGYSNSFIFFVVFFTIREKTRRCIGYTCIQQKRRHGTAVFIRRNIKNEKICKNRRSRAADAMLGEICGTVLYSPLSIAESRKTTLKTNVQLCGSLTKRFGTLQFLKKCGTLN